MLEVRQLLISESIPKVQLTILMSWWLNRCFCKLEHICQIIELVCCYMWFKMTAHKWLYCDKYHIDGKRVQLCSSPLKTFHNTLFIVTLWSLLQSRELPDSSFTSFKLVWVFLCIPNSFLMHAGYWVVFLVEQ